MDSIQSKYLYSIVGIIIAIIVALFLGGYFGGFKFLNIETFKSYISNTHPQNPADASANPAQENNASKSDAPSDENSIPPRYYSLDHNFFFDTPKGFRFTEISDDKGLVVLAEGSVGESFQIFVTPFDEFGPLTPERIKKDLPQKVISNPRTATLDGVKVLVFSTREGSDDVFEAWFVHDGSLFQITTKAEFSDELQKILQTWKFTN
ncbi:MAG: hypothetical protein AAB950_00505 [Patescibacteria group bacterium]